jgi:hypothetical protein
MSTISTLISATSDKPPHDNRPDLLHLIARYHGAGRGLGPQDMAALMSGSLPRDDRLRPLGAGLSALGIKHNLKEFNSSSELAAALTNGGAAILRKIGANSEWGLVDRQGVRGEFRLCDPAIGSGEYGLTEISSWYHTSGFTLMVAKDQNDVNFLSAAGTGSYYEEAVELACETFFKICPPETTRAILSETDDHLGRVLLRGGKVIAAYLIKEEAADFLPYTNLRGIHGQALVLSNEERGQGLGSMLRRMPAKLDYDYVWGMQLKSLGNINEWLKRRVLLKELYHLYITAEPISNAAKIEFTKLGLTNNLEGNPRARSPRPPFELEEFSPT